MKEVTWMKQGLFNAGTPEATEGEYSEPKEALGMPEAPDPEVSEKPSRRRFSGNLTRAREDGCKPLQTISTG